MRIKLIALFYICFSSAAAVDLVVAQEMTVEELKVAYEESFTSLHSWDITYTSGHIVHWDDWNPKSGTNLYPLHRWRKSKNIERTDREQYVGDVPVLRGKSEKQDSKAPVMLQEVPVSQYTEYTDGEKLWRFSGDLGRTDFIDILEEGNGNGEIRPLAQWHNAVLSNFPYHSFYFSLLLDKKTYSIPQILKEFRTEIIDQKQKGNNLIITTRSYLPSLKKDPKRFIQISFDSSVGYFPKQIVFPFSTALDGKDAIANIPYYVVRDFVEYHSSEDGAFFPVKIIASQTNDINKLEKLEPIGKTAAISIVLNKPIDIPAVEFPQGAIVVIEEEGKYTSYIWVEGNKPLKVFTEADFEAAAKRKQERAPGLPSSEGISPIRIFFIVIGVIMIITALVSMALKRER